MTDATLQALIERLEKATVKLEGLASSQPTNQGNSASSGSSEGGVSSPAVSAFDELVNGAFKDFLSHSKTIGGLVAEQVFSLYVL
jgi:hypothetical protein